MTPEERAKRVHILSGCPEQLGRLEQIVAEEIRLAIAEEKEACAQVGDRSELNCDCAAAIRARP